MNEGDARGGSYRRTQGAVVSSLKGREVSLVAFDGDREIFSCSGSWLHPIFELETFLERSQAISGITYTDLWVRDKVIGRAAALLFIRLGVRRVETPLISELAIEVLHHHGCEVDADQIIPSIQCRTEALLAGVFDPDEAHSIIKGRIEANRQQDR